MDKPPRRTPEERRRDPERTKRRIVEAARAEFSAKGFAGTRVSEIAARAGVNKQLISYYFGGIFGGFGCSTESLNHQARSEAAQPSLSFGAGCDSHSLLPGGHLMRMWKW